MLRVVVLRIELLCVLLVRWLSGLWMKLGRCSLKKLNMVMVNSVKNVVNGISI